MNELEHLIMLRAPTEESPITFFLASPTLNVHRRDESGKTLLHYAVQWNHASVLKLLLAAGADVNAMDNDGHTPLDYCRRYDAEGCYALLTQTNGKRNDKQDPPLILRIHAHEPGRLREVLQGGADVNATDSDGCPALVWAIIHAARAQEAYRNAALECLHILLKHPEININQSDKKGCLPLHHAVAVGSTECIRLLLQTGDCDINQADRQGTTALHLALSSDKTACAHLLVTAPGINVHLPNKHGETPLHLAAAHGNADMVRHLLTRSGIQVNARTAISQNTPLMQAVRHPECVRLLVNDARTDVSLKNFMGETALSLAHQWGNAESLQHLRIRHSADAAEP